MIACHFSLITENKCLFRKYLTTHISFSFLLKWFNWIRFQLLILGVGICQSLYHEHELLIAKFRLKLKKVGKTTRPFRYDLNQIPYIYTVAVTNRFKI